MSEYNITPEVLTHWCEDRDAPVALTLRQVLQSVEGDGPVVIFPPTYAKVKDHYNIDTLADGTKVVTIDSVGSQANRLEPLFLPGHDNPLAELVPQLTMTYGANKMVNLLEVGHRLGDASVRSSDFKEEAARAFETYKDSGDASLIARLAPTSLVFGVWDSRGSGVKLPRILKSEIRGWNVERLTRSAQFNPAVNYVNEDLLSKQDLADAQKDLADAQSDEGKKEKKSPAAQRGFIHVPATEAHGGVLVHGDIERRVTINLVALRRLDGPHGPALRRYILALALVAASAELDGDLRQGCLLVPDSEHTTPWQAVSRNGTRSAVTLDHAELVALARKAKKTFGTEADRQAPLRKDLIAEDIAKAKKSTKKKNKE